MEKIQKYTAHDGMEGDLFIVDNSALNIMPFFCPVCEFIMNSHEDFGSHSEFSCCEECKTTFAEPNREKWNSGWRPTEKDLNTYKGRILGQSLNLFLNDEDN